MQRMGYTPNEEAANSGGFSAEPGTYPFLVEEYTEKTFNTGSRGASLKLKVRVSPDKTITVYDNLVFVDKAQWKIKQFLEGVGLSYDPPPEVRLIFNARGKAVFEVDDQGKYLRVAEYLPAPANNGPDTRQTHQAPAMPDDDVPF